MTKYMLSIFGDSVMWDSMTPAEWEAHDAAHVAFRAAAGDRVVGGEQLVSPPVATTLRAGPDGGLVLTDGPFLETKEGLGGYYVVEAADLDAAIALARLLPELTAGHSGVEIRPIREHS